MASPLNSVTLPGTTLTVTGPGPWEPGFHGSQESKSARVNRSVVSGKGYSMRRRLSEAAAAVVIAAGLVAAVPAGQAIATASLRRPRIS